MALKAVLKRPFYCGTTLVQLFFALLLSAAIPAQEVKLPELELQLNSKFWQLLSWKELESLSEPHRNGNTIQRVIMLDSLYPQFQNLESIDSRNLQGELLEVEVSSLDGSYLELGQDGTLTLNLMGEIQENPQQLNIYGESWPAATLQVWIEEGFDESFLLSELETYQRFHKLQIEVQVVRDIRQTLSHVAYGEEGSGNLPDIILADRRTTVMLQNMFQNLSLQELREENSLAYLELFANSGHYYSTPLALETYSFIYNSELLDLEASGKQLGIGQNLSQLFDALAEVNSRAGNGENSPYFLGFGSDTMPFSLLLASFLKSGNILNLSPDTPGLHAGLQYLREQGQKGLLRQIDHAEERFANGDIAAVMTLSGNLRNILNMTKAGPNGKAHIRVAKLPHNDLFNNDISQYSKIWSLSILRDSPAKSQAAGLRSYLLRGGVQGYFNLRSGLLPSNTIYYPFYQRDAYYQLLPKAELRFAMNPEELWEYGIERRSMYRYIGEFDRLFQGRIAVLLDSNIGLSTLLADIQQQWNQEVNLGQELPFLR